MFRPGQSRRRRAGFGRLAGTGQSVRARVRALVCAGAQVRACGDGDTEGPRGSNVQIFACVWSVVVAGL